MAAMANTMYITNSLIIHAEKLIPSHIVVIDTIFAFFGIA